MNKERAVVAVLTLVDSSGLSIIGAIAIGVTANAELTVLLLKESGICVDGSSTTIIRHGAAQFNTAFDRPRKDFPGWKLNYLLCTLHFQYEFKGGTKAKLCCSIQLVVRTEAWCQDQLRRSRRLSRNFILLILSASRGERYRRSPSSRGLAGTLKTGHWSLAGASDSGLEAGGSG